MRCKQLRAGVIGSLYAGMMSRAIADFPEANTWEIKCE